MSSDSPQNRSRTSELAARSPIVEKGRGSQRAASNAETTPYFCFGSKSHSSLPRKYKRPPSSLHEKNRGKNIDCTFVRSHKAGGLKKSLRDENSSLSEQVETEKESLVLCVCWKEEGERVLFFSCCKLRRAKSYTHCMSGGERKEGDCWPDFAAAVDVVPLPPPPSRLAFGS